MDKTLLSIYKLPFLISLVLGIAMLGMGAVRLPLQIAGVLVGSFFGMFVLDLEYFINAYIFDTKSDFSKTLVNFVGHGDWKNAFKHLYYHKDESRENSLNSALFQIILALLCIFVMYSAVTLFAKALVISVFAQSIYALFEHYFKNKTDDWFWTFAQKPSRENVQIYIGGMICILFFCLYLF